MIYIVIQIMNTNVALKNICNFSGFCLVLLFRKGFEIVFILAYDISGFLFEGEGGHRLSEVSSLPLLVPQLLEMSPAS